MSKSFLLMMCLLTGLLVLACGRADTNRNAETNSATATAPVPAGTPATNANTTAAADQVGVAECDNFITAYENCVSSKVPDAGRAQLRNAVTTWRTEWKKLAEDPQTRAQLAAACQRQLEATRTQMRAYGCTF